MTTEALKVAHAAPTSTAYSEQGWEARHTYAGLLGQGLEKFLLPCNVNGLKMEDFRDYSLMDYSLMDRSIALQIRAAHLAQREGEE